MDLLEIGINEITDMSNIFSEIRHFNEDISKWDVSKVVDIPLCFIY